MVGSASGQICGVTPAGITDLTREREGLDVASLRDTCHTHEPTTDRIPLSWNSTRRSAVIHLRGHDSDCGRFTNTEDRNSEFVRIHVERLKRRQPPVS